VQHLRYEVGQHDASLRRQSRDAQTRLTRPSGNVEMLMIFSDAETLDHRCADRSQLIHDDRVPLLPARGEPGPRRSLNVSDLIGARHRPSVYRCIHRTRMHSLAGVHTARSGVAGAVARLRDRSTDIPAVQLRAPSYGAAVRWAVSPSAWPHTT